MVPKIIYDGLKSYCPGPGQNGLFHAGVIFKALAELEMHESPVLLISSKIKIIGQQVGSDKDKIVSDDATICGCNTVAMLCASSIWEGKIVLEGNKNKYIAVARNAQLQLKTSSGCSREYSQEERKTEWRWIALYSACAPEAV